MRNKHRTSTQANEASLHNNPFSALDLSAINLVDGVALTDPVSQSVVASRKNGRVDLRREKAGRSGKTVTILEGISNADDRKNLLIILKKHCGCGGTIKGELIEIQGDKRNEIAKVLSDRGYRVVLAGG